MVRQGSQARPLGNNAREMGIPNATRGGGYPSDDDDEGDDDKNPNLSISIIAASVQRPWQCEIVVAVFSLYAAALAIHHVLAYECSTAMCFDRHRFDSASFSLFHPPFYASQFIEFSGRRSQTPATSSTESISPFSWACSCLCLSRQCAMPSTY
jgi:hypothetical protein